MSINEQSVPCHHIREYRYVYGAVEAITGEGCFLIMPYCNTDCMNVFINHLSLSYPDNIIVLLCDPQHLCTHLFEYYCQRLGH